MAKQLLFFLCYLIDGAWRGTLSGCIPKTSGDFVTRGLRARPLSSDSSGNGKISSVEDSSLDTI